MKDRVLIFSGCEYSLDNKGDHAMLLGLVNLLTNIDSNLEIIVYAMEKGALKQVPHTKERLSPEVVILKNTSSLDTTTNRLKLLFNGILFLLTYILYYLFGTRVFRKDSPVLGFFNHIQNARALFFSGGGYVNSLWWRDGLYSKTFAALVAKISGVPVVLTSQGFGPFTHRLDKWVARLLFQISTMIGTRDEESIKTAASICKSCGKKAVLTWDDAIRVPPSKPKDSADLSLFTNAEYITVNFRNSSSYHPNYPIALEEFAKLLDTILDRTRMPAVFIPISFHENDNDISSALAITQYLKNKQGIFVVKNQTTPEILKWIISKSTLSIGVSYHFLLFSLSQNIPSIAIHCDPYYQKKHKGLFELYNIQNLAFSIKQNQEILDHVLYLLSNSGPLRSKLARRNTELKSQLTITEKKIAEILSHAS
jgi:polysaccharide pyruvyl transferase WcaK-like protein